MTQTGASLTAGGAFFRPPSPNRRTTLGTRTLIPDYEPQAIEARWKARWAADDAYRCRTWPEPGLPERPPYYVLEFFPYPSGEGLTVGHLRNYLPSDVVARIQRMRGFEVLHPMGWDAFGLPAENKARREGAHPAETTRAYAATFKRQLQLVSASYDWSRELFSTDPDYYRWTQWIFLLLYERGLAYRGASRPWWCPECATVLANEQVRTTDDGPFCWRDHPGVYRREVTQWFFRVTGYADRLLADLEGLDWPEGIRAMQRNWIGRQEGARIDFTVVGRDLRIPVFTTRADTLFGVTALVVAPEHPDLPRIATPDRRGAVTSYREASARRAEVDRRAGSAGKSGVFTGSHARHPLSGERVPIWVADYVLPDHGTGAIMLVPAHDERDADFAAAMGLPSRRVIRTSPQDSPGLATGPGMLVDSGRYSGMDSAQAAREIVDDLSALGVGAPETTYRLRDWSIGRQRFWGAPIPVVHCGGCGVVPVPTGELPVRLPDVERVPPPGVGADGRPLSPLAAVQAWVATSCPRCGGPARRETDTMDGFACSSWYFLRFIDPHNDDVAFDPDAVRRWMPVDLYVGGAEHAVLHLLYARFVTKVLFDAGLVGVEEPFARLRNQGMLLDATGRKMSKSRPEHVVTPDGAVAAHGADAVRAYLLFLAPFEQDVEWSEEGISGVERWLRRVWRLALAEPTDAPAPHGSDVVAATHRAIRDVTEAVDGYRFNVAVARLMTFTNELVAAGGDGGAPGQDLTSAVDTLVVLMAPFTPHIAEELWARRGRSYSIHQRAWPDFDPDTARSDDVEIVVQVDGRVRARMSASRGASAATLKTMALAEPAVVHRLAGGEPRRVVVVRDRLVNVVTGGGDER